jgi:hypothetical protein
MDAFSVAITTLMGVPLDSKVFAVPESNPRSSESFAAYIQAGNLRLSKEAIPA